MALKFRNIVTIYSIFNNFHVFNLKMVEHQIQSFEKVVFLP